MIWNFCQKQHFLRLGKFLLSACIQNGLPKYLTDWFHWKFGCEFFIFDFVTKSIEYTSKIVYLCQSGQFMRTGILCQLNKKNCAIEKQVTVRLISCEYSFQNINVIPVVKRKDVSFISFIFQKNFWNKWYLIWKLLYRAFRISKKIGHGIILRLATPP